MLRMLDLTGRKRSKVKERPCMIPRAAKEIRKRIILEKEDYLIILGDVGVCWDGGAGDAFVQECLHNLPCTVLFIDGNHENFDLLEQYPEEEWHGGNVQYIQEDIIHLRSGYYI